MVFPYGHMWRMGYSVASGHMCGQGCHVKIGYNAGPGLVHTFPYNLCDKLSIMALTCTCTLLDLMYNQLQKISQYMH